ncbi:MAG: hypothetical protein ACYC6L_12140 [Anaerolineae bacterium]
MMEQPNRKWQIVVWSVLAFLAFILVAIVIPLWIRSLRPTAPVVAAANPSDEQRNATKIAILATAETFPTAQFGVKGIKPLEAGELTITPEATAYAPFSAAVKAGIGAIVEVQPPFPATVYRILNAWYYDDEQGTRRTFVWAGSLTRQGEEEPGIVIVQVYQRNDPGQEPETQEYQPPAGIGALKITGADGTLLRLSAEGHELVFNVLTREFSEP